MTTVKSSGTTSGQILPLIYKFHQAGIQCKIKCPEPHHTPQNEKNERKKMSKAETDVILNRTNIALARSQRLVASWLPPQTQEEAENPLKSEEEMLAEEEEMFVAVPETYVLLLTKFIKQFADE